MALRESRLGEQPALRVSPAAAVEMPAGPEKGAYDLDVLVSVTRTADAEHGVGGPADGEAHLAGARALQGSVCRANVAVWGDDPRTDDQDTFLKNWFMAFSFVVSCSYETFRLVICVYLLFVFLCNPTSRLLPLYAWLSGPDHVGAGRRASSALHGQFRSRRAGSRLMVLPCEAGVPRCMIHVVDGEWSCSAIAG